jgi:hypothetical protein
LLVSSKVNKVLFFLVAIIFIIPACEKNNENDDGWKNCTECTIDSWIGEYTGKGDFNNLNNNSIKKNVDVFITIEQTAIDYLTVYFQSPSNFSVTVSGDLASPDIISFAGSSSSFTATMFIKDGVLKLTGNAKKFHYKVDSLVVDQVITFETNYNQ